MLRFSDTSLYSQVSSYAERVPKSVWCDYKDNFCTYYNPGPENPYNHPDAFKHPDLTTEEGRAFLAERFRSHAKPESASPDSGAPGS